MYATDSSKKPLLGGSQSTDGRTSVEDNTPSLHSDEKIDKAEQSKKPSPAGSQTTTATNEEVEQSFSQFHGSCTVGTGLFLYRICHLGHPAMG